MKEATAVALLDACAAAAGALEGAARIFVGEGRPMVAKGLRDIYAQLFVAMTAACSETVAEGYGRAAMEAIQKAKAS